MSWAGRLDLSYRSEDWRDGGRRSVRHDRHEGPLRVLASLYPEAPAVCHDVLVHPPGGIAGGDTLNLDIDVAEGAHALLTMPGATRFYRSGGAPALQTVDARLAPGARLEWLPLETIVHAGALAESRLRFTLAPGAEMMGWDLLALGLPAADQAFDRGRYLQQVELPGRWLERGRVDATDMRLLDSPLGWDGQRVLGLLWFAAGDALEPVRVEALLDAARASVAASPLAARAGATAPHEGVVVLRVLAPRVEPAMTLLSAVWARWRPLAWQLAPSAPRVWRT